MTAMAQRPTSNIVLVVIAVMVAVLVAVAVVFALQPPTEFDPNTPEGTAQGYFRAVNDGDQDLAETFMTDELRTKCHWEWWFRDATESSRVVITDTEIEGDSASVSVAITVSYGEEPFGGSSYDEKQVMAMERAGDSWLISAPVWPMDPYACENLEG